MKGGPKTERRLLDKKKRTSGRRRTSVFCKRVKRQTSFGYRSRGNRMSVDLGRERLTKVDDKPFSHGSNCALPSQLDCNVSHLGDSIMSVLKKRRRSSSTVENESEMSRQVQRHLHG